MLAVVGVFRMVRGIMFMVFVRMNRVTVRLMGVVRRSVMITGFMMSMSLAVMMSGGFVMKRGVMMVVVFSHSFLGFRGLTKVPVLRAIDK